MTMPPGPPGPSPSSPPPAFVDLTVQGSVMSASMIPPRVTVNGWPVQPGYGRRILPVAPGPVRVDAEAQWWRTYGRANLAFHAAPGQTVPVFYASPYSVFHDGSMGHVPQKRRGAAVLWGTLAVVVTMVTLITVLAVLAS